MSDTQALTTTNDAQGDGAIAPRSAHLPAAHVEEVVGQVQAIQRIMDKVMHEGTHYGTIPGTDKPTLYKPGAEKLSMAFRFAPEYDVDRHDLDDGHREYEVRCRLIHIPSGDLYGEGVGSCSTMESKYRYRKIDEATDVEVPKSFWDSGDDMKSRNAQILRNALELAGVDVPEGADVWVTKDGGTWLISIKAKGENPDIADVYNTVLKMAKKRAHVDAVLTATAASDIFTQDLEDMPAAVVGGTAKQKPARQQPPKQGELSMQSQQPKARRQNAQKEAERSAKVARLIDQMIERLTGLPDEERGKELERIAEYIEDWPASEKSRVVETLTEEELLLPPDHERATRGDRKLFFADDAF